MTGDSLENASQSTNSLGELSQALRAATSAPRFFRTIQQWVGAFCRYMTAAIATKHLTVVAATGHLQTVSRVSEEARAGNQYHVALAVCYDELRRKSWVARAARCDGSLDIPKESWSVDREILDLAKSRLEQVVTAAGLKKNSGSMPSGVQPSAESALAKSTAAADAATKRAEQAISRLEKAKSSQGGKGNGRGGDNRNHHDDRGGGGGKHGGKGGGARNRQREERQERRDKFYGNNRRNDRDRR